MTADPYPLVSIVTPSLDQGRYLEQAIESVLGQDYPHVEYRIVDGGSTDETAAIAARYATRLSFTREPDRGQSHAINKGFRRARGEIVQWLNADDRLEPGAIAAVVEAFRRAPRSAAAYGGGQALDVDGRPVGAPCPAPSPFDLYRLGNVSDTLSQPCVFLRRAAVLELGGVDESLHWAMDWDLFLRLAERHSFVRVDRPLAAWREYPETKTRSGGWRRFRELVKVIRRHARRRFPPAYLLYLAQTLEFQAERRAARASRAWPSRSATLLRRLQYRLWKETLQWYSDGWAAPLVDLRLPRRPGRLRLRGNLPELPELAAGQRLTVTERGRALAGLDLAPGSFELLVDPSAWVTTIDLRLRARRSFVPGRDRDAPDDRRIAYRLREVAWVTSDGEVDVVAACGE